MYTPKELALRAAKALDDRKGLKIRLLQVTDVTSIADYFLICTGTSNTHVKTLCDSVEAAVADELGEPVTAIATGGVSRMIVPACRREIVHDPNLLLKGLWDLYKLNA